MSGYAFLSLIAVTLLVYTIADGHGSALAWAALVFNAGMFAINLRGRERAR